MAKGYSKSGCGGGRSNKSAPNRPKNQSLPKGAKGANVKPKKM